MTPDDDPAVLRRGLDQLAALLDDLPGGALGDPTPCEQWSVQDLVDHVVAAPSRFARMVRGEEVDWSATPSAGRQPAAQFRSNAEDLLRAVADEAAPGVALDWQCAELAVHTWDLATAIGRSTGDLDAEVADRLPGAPAVPRQMAEPDRVPATGAAVAPRRSACSTTPPWCS